MVHPAVHIMLDGSPTGHNSPPPAERSPPKMEDVPLHSTNLNPPKAFHLFPLLPTEIRIQIWTLCLPPSPPRPPHHTPYNPTCWIKTPLPSNNARAHWHMSFDHTRLPPTPLHVPTAFVNHEAYSVARSYLAQHGIKYTDSLGWHIPFDPDNDALFLPLDVFSDWERESRRRWRAQWDGVEGPTTSRCEVKTVAVGLETVRKVHGDIVMGLVGEHLRGVRTVVVVVGEEGEEMVEGEGARNAGEDLGWRDAPGSGLVYDEERGAWHWGRDYGMPESLNEHLAAFLFAMAYGEEDFSTSTLREVRAVVAVRR